MIILLLFYLIPLGLTLWIAKKAKTDSLFAADVHLKSYVGLAVLIIAAFIPIINILAVSWSMMTLSENKHFTKNPKWRLHK